MGIFWSYLIRATLYWAPLIIVASWVKGAPWWTPFPLLGVILVLASGTWLAVFLCRRYGGELGRKLTEPL